MYRFCISCRSNQSRGRDRLVQWRLQLRWCHQRIGLHTDRQRLQHPGSAALSGVSQPHRSTWLGNNISRSRAVVFYCYTVGNGRIAQASAETVAGQTIVIVTLIHAAIRPIGLHGSPSARAPVAGSNRATSYFPFDTGKYLPVFTSSSHRSFNSRAAATNRGSFFCRTFGSAFTFSATAPATGAGANRNPPDAIEVGLITSTFGTFTRGCRGFFSSTTDN
jgi:hypothetical protein